ncbi:MAG: family 20 glycosylhydrolase [Muribaculaceae bacterium]|nr:family 20 glycosylhydrolase [Muribaculaceae bacterium]
MKTPIFLRLAAAVFAVAASLQCRAELDLTPMPQSVELLEGSVAVPRQIGFATNMTGSDLADLNAYLPAYSLPLKHDGRDPWLRIELVPDSAAGSAEGYRLTVTGDGARIEAATATGAFYALQTLAQLARGRREVPAVDIADRPRFPYRGVHIDVSRHFFDTGYIKKQLDLLATYKVNRLHWHLTDATGWRLEIPSRPRLTEFAAWRPERLYTDWRKNGRYCEHDTPGAYGGYYTEADVRDVVEYARLRHITVIPEIEMPGHSAEVCAAYPELSCYGEPYRSGEVCIGSEATFRFFEDVLDEVIRIFPSHYIHIGGDEASRHHWQQCAKCRQRIADEGLDGEAGLQSYMIERIERFVRSRGRDIIGWDEILDGGLAPNATVMSWRGVEGGIKAAQMGHDAIMTPEAYCYLDHYQDDPETQPVAFGSPVTIFQCYSFDPAPAELGDDVAGHIIGVQGNNWAEYIPTREHGEYMLYPRIIALAEVGWTEPARKDAQSFKRRVNAEARHIRSLGYNPFMLSEQVQTAQTVDYDRRHIVLELTSEKDPIYIRYTTDGSEPTAASPLYVQPFIVKDSILLTAQLFDGQQPIGRPMRLRTDYHKGIGKTIAYADSGGYYRDKELYMAGGDSGLLDGLRGGKSYMDGRWQGFCPNNLDAVVDLGEVMEISRVMANFMQIRTPLVFLPARVEVWASTDGADFRLLGEDVCPPDEAERDVAFRDFGWTGAPVRARYVRFRAEQARNHFLFTDEIIIQ